MFYTELSFFVTEYRYPVTFDLSIHHVNKTGMSTNIRLITQAERCDHDADDATRNTETQEKNGERHYNNKMRIPPIFHPVTVIYFATPSDVSGQVRSYNHDVTDFAEVATQQNAGESHPHRSDRGNYSRQRTVRENTGGSSTT